jgi:hypothetical protein
MGNADFSPQTLKKITQKNSPKNSFELAAKLGDRFAIY